MKTRAATWDRNYGWQADDLDASVVLARFFQLSTYGHLRDFTEMESCTRRKPSNIAS
jgi:hypothetical protein